jgi:hypothetical protein
LRKSVESLENGMFDLPSISAGLLTWSFRYNSTRPPDCVRMGFKSSAASWNARWFLPRCDSHKSPPMRMFYGDVSTQSKLAPRPFLQNASS